MHFKLSKTNKSFDFKRTFVWIRCFVSPKLRNLDNSTKKCIIIYYLCRNGTNYAVYGYTLQQQILFPETREIVVLT